MILFFSYCSNAFAAEKYVLFILDTSGSMHGEKIAMANRVLLQMLKKRPRNTEVALRIFNQHANTLEESCKGSETILDFNDYDVQVFKETLNNIQVNGQTPLAYTLDEAWYDFPEKDKKREIVMITDGQDTCDGDPCERAWYISKYYGVTVNVIAIDVDKPDLKNLMCIPKRAGGRFYDIKDQSGLMQSASEILSLPTSPLIVTLQNDIGEKIFGEITIYDDYGDVVAETTQPLREFSPTLPIGIYSVTADVDGEEKTVNDIKLKENTPAEITIVF